MRMAGGDAPPTGLRWCAVRTLHLGGLAHFQDELQAQGLEGLFQLVEAGAVVQV